MQLEIKKEDMLKVVRMSQTNPENPWPLFFAADEAGSMDVIAGLALQASRKVEGELLEYDLMVMRAVPCMYDDDEDFELQILDVGTFANALDAAEGEYVVCEIWNGALDEGLYTVTVDGVEVQAAAGEGSMNWWDVPNMAYSKEWDVYWDNGRFIGFETRKNPGYVVTTRVHTLGRAAEYKAIRQMIDKDKYQAPEGDTYMTADNTVDPAPPAVEDEGTRRQQRRAQNSEALGDQEEVASEPPTTEDPEPTASSSPDPAPPPVSGVPNEPPVPPEDPVQPTESQADTGSDQGEEAQAKEPSSKTRKRRTPAQIKQDNICGAINLLKSEGYAVTSKDEVGLTPEKPFQECSIAELAEIGDSHLANLRGLADEMVVSSMAVNEILEIIQGKGEGLVSVDELIARLKG
jgi:hypothetical protein